MGVPLAQACYRLGGVQLRVESDDAPLLDELSSTFGRPEEADDTAATSELAAAVHSIGRTDGYAHVQLCAEADDLLSPDDLLLGLASPEFPFRRLPARAPWFDFALASEQEPFLSLNGGDCRVRLRPLWRKAVALLLLQRLMRARRDAIFFHAASVAVGGRGVLLIGSKGAGKSTLALALTARGHQLLGDEHACYRPATREILPFRRPVGVKPGPRSAGVDRALERLGRRPERDGMMRLDAALLFPGSEAKPAPLTALVFLAGFASFPRASAVEPGREELTRLQPLAGSLVNAPRRQRVFQMAQMLAHARVFQLTQGDPDASAAWVEEAAPTWA